MLHQTVLTRAVKCLSESKTEHFATIAKDMFMKYTNLPV